jgi:L-ribulose-5-phosphate 3-epimerase
MNDNSGQQLPSRRSALKNLSLLGLGCTGVLSAWANGTGKKDEGQKHYPAGVETTAPQGSVSTAASKIRFAVSSYSYWHFEPTKYPIEKVIEHASDLGFDGVEILHRQMENESVAYMNKLKRMAFDRGLALPLLSIHQNFLQPDKTKRAADIKHTFKCIDMAAQMGIPCVRMNTGSWGTVKNKKQTDYYQTGIEPPIEGYTDEDGIKWTIEGMKECLAYAEKHGVTLALENHWGLSSNLDYLLRMYEALKDSPAMGLNVDTGNFVGEPYAHLQRLAPHASIVQAKTYYGGGTFYDKEMDYSRIGKIFKDAGYKGYVSLEFEGKEDPHVAVPKSLELLKKSFA